MKTFYLCLLAVFATFCITLLVDAQVTPCTSQNASICGPRGNCQNGVCQCHRNCDTPSTCGIWVDSAAGACSLFLLESNFGSRNCTVNPQLCGPRGNCENGTCVCHKNCVNLGNTTNECGIWISTALTGYLTPPSNSSGFCDVFSECTVDHACAYCNVTTPVFTNTSQCAQCTTDRQCSYYHQVNLVSSLTNIGLNSTDSNLINPWDMDFNRQTRGPWYITATGTGKILVYHGNGTLSNVVIDVPSIKKSSTGTNSTNSTEVSGPTGIVWNPNNSSFILPNSTQAARFIVVTLEGTIMGVVGNNNATVLAVNNTETSVYTGATIYHVNRTVTNSTNNSTTTVTDDYLLAANWAAKLVEIYDKDFQLVDVFQDTSVPANMSVYNVANVNGTLIIAFALINETSGLPIIGRGTGLVKVYNVTSNGIVPVRTFNSTRLNSPWGLAIAPENWGKFSRALLVGNFGDGVIHGFNITTGEYLGKLLNRKYETVNLDFGLWAIKFGNDGQAGRSNQLFFVSGIKKETHGLFGYLTAGGTCSSGRCNV